MAIRIRTGRQERPLTMLTGRRVWRLRGKIYRTGGRGVAGVKSCSEPTPGSRSRREGAEEQQLRARSKCARINVTAVKSHQRQWGVGGGVRRGNVAYIKQWSAATSCHTVALSIPPSLLQQRTPIKPSDSQSSSCSSLEPESRSLLMLTWQVRCRGEGCGG